MCEDDPHEQSHSTESIPTVEHFPPIESKPSSDDEDSSLDPIYQDTEDEEDEF